MARPARKRIESIDALDEALASLQSPAEAKSDTVSDLPTAPTIERTVLSDPTPAPPADAAAAKATPAVAQLEAAWSRLNDELTAAEDILGTFENERFSIAAAGGDVAAHSRKLIEARENVRTLEGATTRAKAAYEAARDQIQREQVRTDIGASSDAHCKAVAEGWRAAYKAMSDLKAALTAITTHSSHLEAANWQAEHNGLSDVVVNVRGLRSQVAEEINGGPLWQRPEPGSPFRVTGKNLGVADNSPSGRDPMDAFDLIEANKEALAQQEAARKEPFKVATDEIIDQLSAVVLEVPEHMRRKGPDRFRHPKALIA